MRCPAQRTPRVSSPGRWGWATVERWGCALVIGGQILDESLEATGNGGLGGDWRI